MSGHEARRATRQDRLRPTRAGIADLMLVRLSAARIEAEHPEGMSEALRPHKTARPGPAGALVPYERSKTSLPGSGASLPGLRDSAGRAVRVKPLPFE